MNNIKDYVIIGYSLEACFIARKMANQGKKVKFLITGELGHPCDDINDHMDEDAYRRIYELGIDFPINKISNGFYVHVPYEGLRMVNDANGLVSYPLNRSSFESAEEQAQIQFRIDNYCEFSKKIEKSTNYINIYKKFLPKWLFESIVKHIGVNKWNLKQSQFTKDSLLKEVDLSRLNNQTSGVIYRPADGYKNLCKRLLTHSGIKVEKEKLTNIKEIFRTRYRSTLVIFIDNRIDYICDYSMGKLDRVLFESTEIPKDEKMDMDEYACIDNAVILTPLAEYWALSCTNGENKKIYSNELTEIGDETLSMILPSQANLKTINEYSKLFKRYPNKDFIFPTPLTILR